MIYCTKCGRKLDDNDKFCTHCGERVSKKAGESAGVSPSHGMPQQKPSYTTNQPHTNEPHDNPKHTEAGKADENPVQYVYVNKKTGRITGNPHVKTSSEGCLQYVIS